MKKQNLFFTALLAVACFFLACNSTQQDPRPTLANFFEALSKKDFDKAKMLVTEDSKGTIDLMSSSTVNIHTSETDKYAHEKLDLGQPVISGDNATIPVKEKNGDETINFRLRKENGTWKVVFNVGALLQGITDKMQEKGLSADSLASAIKALKQVSIDSLKMGIDKGINALDSVKKILDKQP
ncbi:MAG: hypothetical protein RL172_1893 [Bacteroidota bacterium]|jgi:hypothetical protein